MNINGLTDEQVIENRNKYGRNIFSKKKRDGFLKLLGIDFEKVNEIFEKIDINAIRKECVFKDAVAFINSDNKNKVELNKMSFEEENKYKSLLAKKEPESKNRTGTDYDKKTKIKTVA